MGRGLRRSLLVTVPAAVVALPPVAARAEPVPPVPPAPPVPAPPAPALPALPGVPALPPAVGPTPPTNDLEAMFGALPPSQVATQTPPVTIPGPPVAPVPRATCDAASRHLQLMIRHHQGGVMMAGDAATHAELEPVREAAQGMQLAQGQEIGQMRAVLAASAPPPAVTR